MTISEQIQAGFSDIKALFSKPDAQSTLTQIQGELAKSQSELATANASLATATTNLATAQTDLTAARADVSRLTGELEAANKKLANPSEQIQASASAQAAAIVAGVGHAPLSLAPTGGEVKTMTRAEFQKLSAQEKSAFSQKGGRLTD